MKKLGEIISKKLRKGDLSNIYIYSRQQRPAYKRAGVYRGFVHVLPETLTDLLGPIWEPFNVDYG